MCLNGETNLQLTRGKLCACARENVCVCVRERERREGKKFWSFCGWAPKALNFLICSTMIIHPFQTSSHWLWHYTYQLITVPHPPFNILFIREVVIEHLTLPQAWALTHTHTHMHAHTHTHTHSHPAAAVFDRRSVKLVKLHFWGWTK